MKKNNIFYSLLFVWISVFIFYTSSSAEDSKLSVQVIAPALNEEAPEVIPPEKEEVSKVLNISDNVTLDFKDADILNVLKIISYKAGINIVTTPEVVGNVTMRLVDVPWENALDVILKTYGFTYQRQENVILVTKFENLAKLQADEPLQTEIFTLKYLDAQDAQKVLVPLVSPRGKISVLYTKGQKGWSFGSYKIGKDSPVSSVLTREKQDSKPETISMEKSAAGDFLSRKADFEPSVKSKVIIITDTVSSLDRIRNYILPKIDKKPKQVLIETRILEVKRDNLRDLGVDWGLGTGGATIANPQYVSAGGGNLAGRNIGSGVPSFTPNAFNALEGATAFPGTYPYVAGAQFVFQQLSGAKLQVVIHALEEDNTTNTLSAPKILTLDNQEASILVGYHTPILASTVTAGDTNSGPTVTQTLDYYQEIGIRLNVVPQISDEGFINMIIHPSVTSSTSNVKATSTAGTGLTAQSTTTLYPIIDVREAQTQILIKDHDTIVIGGLLKDVKQHETIGVPFISKIPWIGKLFIRDTISVNKVDLLIFITASILDEDVNLTKDEQNKFDKGIDYVAPKSKLPKK
ncbi:MAG: secretin and TonB N-terminal domain-containing protein [Candidatus Omnitrophica bacterium]|nr:secretin and TonB N-terminal domain-containing protein [Candidatus Omnitrophota bacterium]